MTKKKTKFTIKRALRDTLPVMAGYLVLGIGFGVLLAAKGYGAQWAVLMSCTMYAGSMQYVAVDLLAGAVSVGYAALMTLLVNARHIFYGISLIDKYKNAGIFRPYLIFALTDETYSLVSSAELSYDIDHPKYYFFVSLFDQLYWIFGCTIGCLLGNGIKFNSAGIEFAMTSLFITIFCEQWLSSKDHKSSLIGVLSTLICLLIFGPQNFLIPSMIVILIMLFAMRGILDRESEAKK